MLVWIGAYLISFLIVTSHSKSFDCSVGYDGKAVINGIAGHEFLCPMEKIETDLFSINIKTTYADWLSYDHSKQLLIGTPEKHDIGSTNISISVRPKSCSIETQWTITVPVIVELPQQGTRSITDSCAVNEGPRVNRPVNNIRATAGEMFNLSLDPLTFMDREDGNTRNLQISLKASFNQNLPDDFWLKLDKTSLILYGIPLQNEVIYVMNLVAMDTCGELSTDSIRLDVRKRNIEYNHEFTIYFGDHRYSNVEVHRFISGLVMWLEPTFPSEIVVSGAEQGQSISWFDKSLSSDVCERQEILNTYYIMADNNGTVLEDFKCFFSPFFNISAVFVDFKGSCNISLLYGMSTDTDIPLNSEPVNDDMYLFYILIPVAILTVVILLVIVILLVKKCMKQNRYVMNSEKPIYLTDRQPVIFQNEYNDEDTTLSPQMPTIIDTYDAAPNDGHLQGRMGANPPSYSVQPQRDPPQYRLPPPYHISGM